MIEQFRERFGSADGVHVFRAPGRTNLIGEHTDYSLGYVLPVALEMAAFIAVAPSCDGKLRLYSENRNELREFDAASLASLSPAHEWTDYVIGVAQQLVRAGYPVEGANLYIRSTVPEGGGLSSSAALEVSSALALLDRRPIDPLELAKLCRRAEVEFVGMPCGIMDQYISVFGRSQAAVKIDCRSLESQAVTLPDVAILAVNTMVKHELGKSAYAERVKQCAAAVEALRTKFPHVNTLRDATLPELDQVRASLDPVVYRRARHVITEDERVERFMSSSAHGDLRAMGAWFYASHRSLRFDYEVSCLELDFLVEEAARLPGVYGARMTGGGFGGCTVNLVARENADEFREQIASIYEACFLIRPRIYDCVPAAGAGEISPAAVPAV